MGGGLGFPKLYQAAGELASQTGRVPDHGDGFQGVHGRPQSLASRISPWSQLRSSPAMAQASPSLWPITSACSRSRTCRRLALSRYGPDIGFSQQRKQAVDTPHYISGPIRDVAPEGYALIIGLTGQLQRTRPVFLYCIEVPVAGVDQDQGSVSPQGVGATTAGRRITSIPIRFIRPTRQMV